MPLNLLEHPNVPRYVKLAEELGEQMRRGILKPGDRLPSFAEMKSRHGVSQNTLDKAHSLLEQQGLIVRQQGRGTFVAPQDASTASKQSTAPPTGLIGLSGGGLAYSGYSPYWSQLQGGAREAAARAGKQLVILEPHSTRGWEKIDGVLVCHWNEDDAALYAAPRNVPIVSVMSPVEGVTSVVADDYGAMQLAIERLLAAGHRNIAFLHGYFNHEVMWKRMAAYHETLETHGIEVLDSWKRSIRGDYFCGAQFTQQAHKYMSQWIAEDWNSLDCTALICWNDESAVGAIRALQESGLQVPRDVSVVGFDGTEFCDVVSPRLSSVKLPLHEIGSTAIEMLVQQIESGTAGREHRVVPVSFLERETVAAPKETARTPAANRN